MVQFPKKTVIVLIGKLLKPEPSCRFLGIHFDAKLWFENFLQCILSKMATAKRSLYL